MPRTKRLDLTKASGQWRRYAALLEASARRFERDHTNHLHRALDRGGDVPCDAHVRALSHACVLAHELAGELEKENL